MIKSLPLLLILCLPLSLFSQQNDKSLFIESRNEPPPFGPLQFRNDSVTITGAYKNFRPGKTFTVEVIDWVYGEAVIWSAPIDSSGRFRLKFPLPAPGSVLLDHNDANIRNIGIPGETIRLFVDLDEVKGTTRFEGANARLHNEIHQYLRHERSAGYPPYRDFAWSRQFTAVPPFCDTIAAIYRTKMKQFNNYHNKHKLEARTRQYLEAYIRYDLGVTLTQQYYLFPAEETAKYEAQYLAAVDSIAGLRFSTGYLSPDYKLVIKNIRDHGEMKAFRLKLDPDSIYDERMRHPMEKILTDAWKSADNFSQGLVYNDSMLTALRLQVTDTFLLKRLQRQNDSLKALDADDHLTADTRFVTEFPELKTPREIFQHVTAPYRGKVIYLDIWGTWCAPCRKMMSFMPAIKKRYADKDVVFLYLANSSPESAWRNAIKQHQITGPNVVHYRMPPMIQQEFEKDYLTGGYPSYLLIDKAGNVVTKQAPWPWQPDALYEAIDKLL